MILATGVYAMCLGFLIEVYVSTAFSIVMGVHHSRKLFLINVRYMKLVHCTCMHVTPCVEYQCVVISDKSGEVDTKHGQ